MNEQGQEKSEKNNKEKDEKLILLLLSNDLRKKFMKTLVNRLQKYDVTVAVDELSYPEEKQKKFHWILNFPGDIPKGKATDTESARLIFRVKGISKLQIENFSNTCPDKLSNLLSRYREVQKTLQSREKNLDFLKLALADSVLRAKKQLLQKYENLKKRLEQKISEVEKPYFNGIGLILASSIEKITGVAVLDGLMKGLIHVMIIDDLDNRSIDGLVKLDFKRKLLSCMSTRELSEKIENFKKEHINDNFAKANIAQFIFNSPDFDHIEIVFFNSWKFNEDSFPVRVALRKKTILSKKDEKKLKQQSQLESKIESEELALIEVKEKLSEIMREISKFEKSHFDDEDEYQVQNNTRRRLIKDIKVRELRIKEMKRPINKGSGEEKIITFDLFDIFKSNQSFLDRIGDTAGSFGLGEFWGKHIQTDDSHSFNKLAEMARFSKEWIRASNQINKISSQTALLAKKLDRFVEKKMMNQESENFEIENELNYQSLLDQHILDSLEVAVLSCEILNVSGTHSKSPHS